MNISFETFLPIARGHRFFFFSICNLLRDRRIWNDAQNRAPTESILEETDCFATTSTERWNCMGKFNGWNAHVQVTVIPTRNTESFKRLIQHEIQSRCSA